MKPSEFEIDRRLLGDTFDICNLPLCNVRLMNNRLFPWLVMIPRVADAVEWIDLPRDDQHRLSDEIAVVSHILQALVTPEKLNIAALGNQVSQLHVHVIARYKADSAWPVPIWGKGAEEYAPEESRKLVYELKSALESLQLS